MKPLSDSPFFRQAFYELDYSFGSYYLFDTFIVAEIHQDVVFTWEDHGKQVARDIGELYQGHAQRLVYIANRINPYAVRPSDWLKFYARSFGLSGYAIVSYTEKGHFNAILEKMFTHARFRQFTGLKEAVSWAKQLPPKRIRPSARGIAMPLVPFSAYSPLSRV